MIPAISLLAGYSIHKKNMLERNYDDYQIDRHKQNLYNIITNDYNQVKGLRIRHMVWLSHFIKCDIIEVGRLQYNYHSIVDLDCLDTKKHHIELHIPGGRPLDMKEIENSFKNSRKYIYKYFNLAHNKELEYYVQSWLLSPELKYFLKGNSNILNFQKLFTVLKYKENLKDFVLFVFNLFDVPLDFTILETRTSLQKEMKKHLLEGKKLHIGIAILKN